jgi:hypothetical protein
VTLVKNLTAPAADWLEEGLWQLRLATTWQACLLWLQSQPAAEARTTALAERLQEEVLEPFVAQEWFSGLRQVLEPLGRLVLDQVSNPAAEDPLDVVCRFIRERGQKCFVEAVPPTPQARQAVDKSAQILLFQGAARVLPAEDFPSSASDLVATKVAAGPSVSPLEVSEQVSLWIAQAQALDGWHTLGAPLEAVAATLPAGRFLHELRDQCQQLMAWIDQRNGTGSPRRWLAYWHGVKDYRLFEYARDTLAQVVASSQWLVASGDGSSPPRATSHWPLATTLRHLLAAVPPSWVPGQLAQFQEELRKANPAAFAHFVRDLANMEPVMQELVKRLGSRLPELSQPVLARLVLLIAVVESIDRLSADIKASEIVWRRVQEWAERLLAGTQLRLTLVRDARGPKNSVTEVCDPNLEQSSVARTGVVVQTSTERTLVLRTARLLVLPPVLDALVGLARSLDTSQPSAAVLAESCREVARALRQHKTVAEWCQNLGWEERARLWTVLQGAVSCWERSRDKSGPPFRLLSALEGEGIWLEEGAVRPADPKTHQDAANVRWFLSALPAGAERRPAPDTELPRFGTLLHTPDNQCFGPAVWLRLSQAAPNRPLVLFLLRAQPLLAHLQAADPEWASWAKYGATLSAIWLNPTGSAATDEAAGLELFRDLWRRTKAVASGQWLVASAVESSSALATSHQPLATMGAAEVATKYRTLASRLYQCLTRDMGLEVFPRLDPQTLELIHLTPETLAGAQVTRWVPHSSPAGTILAVAAFGTATKNADVEASLGSTVPPLAAPWVELPPWNEWERPDADQPAAPCPLERWQQTVWESFWKPEQLTEAVVAQQREAFGRWPGTAEGRDGFNELVHAALRRDGGARRWLNALLRAGWCQCFPQVDFAATTVFWPDSVSLNYPNLDFACEAAFPCRRVVKVERFAAQPEDALCTINLGPPATDAARAAWTLWRTVQEQGPKNPALLAAVRTLWAGSQTASDPERTAALAPELVRPVLDALADPAPTERPVTWKADPLREQILTQLRTWCGLHQFDILPRSWSFKEALTLDTVPASDETTLTPVFTDSPPRTLVGITALGLGRGNQVLTPGRVLVSAGPVSAHFYTLWQLAGRPDSSQENPLRGQLAAWPGVWLDGPEAARFTAVEFFVRFWEQQPKLLKSNRERAGQLARALESLLAEEFQLETFSPTSAQGYPVEWLEYRPAHALRGPIKKVLRPGLKTAAGELKVPAVVEGE